jgi:hypothetical protein
MPFNPLSGYSRESVTTSNIGTNTTVYGRVVDIILDEFHPRYNDKGRSQSINGIFYRELSDSTIEDEEQEHKFAFQGSAAFKQVPLRNEIVAITQGPSYNRDNNANDSILYWHRIVPVWNHPHHNASPDSIQFAKALEADPDVDLGTNFEETDQVNPLQGFPGDLLIEGRQGQSIRFTGARYPSNPLVNDSNSNQPIIILSNGQKEAETGYESILEDINEDKGSMYFLSNHKVPLEQSNKKQDAFDIRPVKFNEYQGNQVLLTSGRLVFNAKEEDILLSSKNNFAVTSNVLGLDSKEYIGIDSKKIFLGIKARRFEDEPVLLGNSTSDWLRRVLEQLENVVNTLATLPPSPGGAVAKLIAQGNATRPILKTLKTEINKLKSKKVFTE